MFPVYTGNFRDLQSCFLSRVRELRRAGPLGPLQIIVPGQLVRLALRRELAGAGAWLNVNFLTLGDAARTLARQRLQDDGWRPLPEALRDPLLNRAIERVRDSLDYFSEISVRPGFRRMLWRTLDELRHTGISAAEFALTTRELSGVTHTLKRKLSDIARIWSELDASMLDYRLADRTTVLKLAAATDETSRIPTMIYGLESLTALESSVVARLTDTDLLAAFVPHCTTVEYEWTLALVRWFTARGGRVESVPTVPGPSTTLSAVQDQIENRANRTASTADDRVRLISAPSRDREIEYVVRKLLHSPLTESKPHRTVGIITRDNRSYTELTRTELNRAGIQGYLHQCRTLADTETGKAVRMLSRLLDGRLRRADVSTLLLCARLKPLRRTDSAPIEISGAEWAHFSAEAGIVEGLEQWQTRLARLQRACDHRRGRAEPGDEATLRDLARQSASLAAFAEFISNLSSLLDAVRASRTWANMAESFGTALLELVALDGEWRDISVELEAVQLLDELRVPVTVDAFRALLDSALSRPVEREGRFGANQPTVVQVEQAVGLLFDELFLPGLVEKEWPRPFSSDPVLSDDERKQLVRVRPRLALSTRDDHERRERFLFASAIGSAQHSVTISWPRSDSTTGRERLASSHVLKTLTLMTGNSVDYEFLDRYVRTSTNATRVPLGRVTGGESNDLATEFQWNLSHIASALESNSLTPLADIAATDSAFARSLNQERNCYLRKEFTSYDGSIQAPVLVMELANYWRSAVAATQLERYATCPFQFFAAHVLSLAESNADESPFQLSPAQRGTMIHEILERFFKPVLADTGYRIDRAEWPRLEAVAARVFEEHEASRLTIVAFPWSVERDRILRMLKIWFTAECNSATASRPVALESQFGSGVRRDATEQPVRISISESQAISLRGRIDRIDELGDGTLRVIDYKTGQRQPSLRDGNLNGGRALQLPLYLDAAHQLFQRNVSGASYVYIGERNEKLIEFTSQHAENGQVELQRMLSVIVAGITSGAFFPDPDPNVCKSCFARAACGQSRLTHKLDVDLEQTRAYRSLRDRGSAEVGDE